MTTVVVTDAAERTDAGRAIERALTLFPARLRRAERAAWGTVAGEIASDAEISYAIFVDAEATLQLGAFARLAAVLAKRPALVGGCALGTTLQRFGAMLAPPRGGPYPFEISPVLSLRSDERFPPLVAGPIDLPERGVLAIERTLLAGLCWDRPEWLSLESGFAARARSGTVVCEPTLAYTYPDALPAVERAYPAMLADIAARYPVRGEHRDPPAIRALAVTRGVRIDGAVRQFSRIARPPVTVVDAAGGAAALRAELARTSDRYVLALAVPATAELHAAIDALEADAARALVLGPERRFALFHGARIPAGVTFAGETVAELLEDAVRTLPALRLCALDADGPIVPAVLPVAAPIATTDVVFVVGSQAAAARGAFMTLFGNAPNGTISVVYPAGSGDVAAAFEPFTTIRLLPDAVDPFLVAATNGALGESRSDAVMLVSDEFSFPRRTLQRLAAALERIPRAAVAIPRVPMIDGAEFPPPEALDGVTYDSTVELENFAARRAGDFARESALIDTAMSRVMLIRREALQTVGGFDPRLGLTREGIADFIRRLRAANYLVLRCDDVYVHRFPYGDSLLARAEQFATRNAAGRAPVAAGFDPAVDRVPFGTVAPVAPAVAEVAGVVSAATTDELAGVLATIALLAAGITADDPVEVVLGLGPGVPVADAAAALRDVLAGAPVPMERTLNIRLESFADPATWQPALPVTVYRFAVLAGTLAALPPIDAAAFIALVRKRAGA